MAEPRKADFVSVDVVFGADPSTEVRSAIIQFETADGILSLRLTADGVLQLMTSLEALPIERHARHG
jgi:hypothetical protein